MESVGFGWRQQGDATIDIPLENMNVRAHGPSLLYSYFITYFLGGHVSLCCDTAIAGVKDSKGKAKELSQWESDLRR
jgi:hypothetical protein